MKDSIPVINFESFSQSTIPVPSPRSLSQEQQQVVEQIKAGFEQTGLVYLQNYGINSTLIRQAFEQSSQFFELPIEVKKQLSWLNAANSVTKTGYIHLEQERLDQTKPADLREAIDMTQLGLESLDWSMTPPGFQLTAQQFYQACATLVDRMLQVLAIGLQISPFFFLNNHAHRDYELLLIHYPPLIKSAKLGQLRAGEHTDYGTLSFLFQHQEGGLEVQTRSGEWLPVPPIPDTVVVAVGDLLERWTNGQLCAPKHRVILPMGEASQRARYCMGFFCHPDYECCVSCLEQYVSPTQPPRYEPVIAGQYLDDLLAVSCVSV